MSTLVKFGEIRKKVSILVALNRNHEDPELINILDNKRIFSVQIVMFINVLESSYWMLLILISRDLCLYAKS